jgi:putative oxidoreductase
MSPVSFGLLLIRGIIGFVMFYHGAQKVLGWFDGKGMEAFTQSVAQLGLPGGLPPEYLAWAAALSEFVGGILLIIGLATRIAALFIVATMAVAVFKVHWGSFPVSQGGMEFALTLGVVALGLIFTGPGRFALDALFARRRTEPPPKTAEKKK